jgi:Ca2+-transporting ATPase
LNEEFAWYSLDINDVLQKFNSGAKGISSKEVMSRLDKFGYNELTISKRVSPLIIFLNQFKSILILILIAATIISFATGHELDAFVILVIVILSALVGFIQEFRAERALEALKRMLSPDATVIRDGKEILIPAREIVPGDIIVLKEGDKVPADARLIEIINLQINEASLTGESLPVRKDILEIPKGALILERKNSVFSGTMVTYGKGKAVVTATGMKTEFGKIAEQVAMVQKEETPLEIRTKELGKWLGIVALIISISVFILGLVRGLPFLSILLFGIALSVAAVPEALPAVVTGSLAIGMRRMAKKNALVRKMSAVETLGSTTIICSDKTGTLTKGEMTVRRIYFDQKFIEITGIGYEPIGTIETDENYNPLSSDYFTYFLYGSILCNDAELINEGEKWRIRGDPTEGALIVAATKLNYSQDEIRNRFPRIGEIPFSSERKRMTTIHSKENSGTYVFIKGAPEVILERCDRIAEFNGYRKISDDQMTKITIASELMAKDALRVLAIAYKEVNNEVINFNEDSLENKLIFLGLLGMIDPPREEVIKAVEICNQVKVKPIMITGDHKNTAMAIAKEIGIYNEGDLVLTGVELEKMDDTQFYDVVEKVVVYARVSPLHKLKIVEAWKKKGQVVAMTGDGVNDAPALKQANIGIAMGITGTEVTKEAGDLILIDDNFATIITAIELGRWVYDNIKKYLTFLIQANLVEIAVLSIAVLLGFPLPLLPVHILYINLATDGFPAIALGVSPSDPDIMKRPPRPPQETIFTKDVKSFLIRALLLEVPLLLWIFTGSLAGGVQIAQTRLFLVFVFFELVLALSCRSLKYNIFKVRPHRLLLFVVLWEAILLIILMSIPFVRELFGIAPIGIFEITLITIICLTVLVSIEFTKRILNILEKRKSR